MAKAAKQPPKQKHIPLRTCVSCHETKPKRELLRVVRTPDGHVSIDATGKKSGRGAYLCARLSCWEQAVQKNDSNRSSKPRSRRRIALNWTPLSRPYLETILHNQARKPVGQKRNAHRCRRGKRKPCRTADRVAVGATTPLPYGIRGRRHSCLFLSLPSKVAKKLKSTA